MISIYSIEKNEVIGILDNYQFGEIFSIDRIKEGVVNTNWIATTTKGIYVVRKVAKFKNLADVKFEMKYLQYLSDNRFPYRIPIPIQTREGKYYVKVGKNIFWIYDYIDGLNKEGFGMVEIEETAKMMAAYHRLIEKSSLINGKGEGDVFNKKPILSELNGFISEILKKAKPNSMEKTFLAEAKTLIPLMERLDGKSYSKLRKYPLHRDLNPENIIWKDDELVGVIDFENVSQINDTIIKDIAGMLQYSCRDEKCPYKLNLELTRFFLMEYRKYHSLSRKEIEFIPDIIVAGAIEDFSYVYWMLKNDPRRAQLNRLKLYAGVAKWHELNRENIQNYLMQ